MTSVLLLQTSDPAPDLAGDFTAAGYTVCGQGDCAHLVRDALRAQADVVVCWAPVVPAGFVEAIALLQAQQAMPLLVFTADADVELMERALRAGAGAWVVQGYGPQRLRALVALARTRAAIDRGLREELAQLQARLEERKLVDQAKGILMRSRQLSEEDAFKLLRSASMQGNQKVGEVSRQVIAAARLAEAVNRAGQQRMLSQRLVKLYALAAAGTDAKVVALLMRETVTRVDENLALLDRELSPATFGDLLEAGRKAWVPLREALQAPAGAQSLPALDAQADALLQQAEALVCALESSGVARPVHVVNVAGRQRMLSQRVAKLALLQPRDAARAAAMEGAARAFEDGLHTLNQAPLSTPAIRELLQQGEQAWRALRAATASAGKSDGRLKVAAASEDLLSLFDRLTGMYQHSVEMLLGEPG